MYQSGQQWCDANVAAGAEEIDARAAAARVTAAYTGITPDTQSEP